MRFHLIDRVDAWKAGESVQARKVTSRTEEFWVEEDGEQVMPPPLVLEALCQAGTWLIMITTERRKRAALLSIGTVDFLGAVRPGDVVLLEGIVESMNDEMAVLSGTATVDGTVVMSAQDIMCALIDAGDLADLDDTHRLQIMLTREETS